MQVIDLSGLPATATLATTLLDTGSQHTAYISNIDYATNMALPGQEAFLYLAGSDVGTGVVARVQPGESGAAAVHRRGAAGRAIRA